MESTATRARVDWDLGSAPLEDHLPPSLRTDRAKGSLTGQPARWAVDMGFVGAGVSVLAPATVILGLYGIALSETASLVQFAPLAVLGAIANPYTLMAAVFGGGSGAMLGAAMPDVLDWLRRHGFRMRTITALAGLLGSLWGGTVAGMATLPFLPMVGFDDELVLFTAGVGALVGALTLGCFWLPYTVQTVMGGKRWPIVLAAVGAAPGWAAATGALAFILLETL